jgi:hypothetical protein
MKQLDGRGAVTNTIHSLDTREIEGRDRSLFPGGTVTRSTFLMQEQAVKNCLLRDSVILINLMGDRNIIEIEWSGVSDVCLDIIVQINVVIRPVAEWVRNKNTTQARGKRTLARYFQR